MGSEIKGLKDVQKRLKEFERKAQEMDGSDVPLTDIITDEFVQRCSNYSSLSDLIDASGYSVESQEDFAAIPDEKWDGFIREKTSYQSWEEMLNAAGQEYMKKHLQL
jgi:hypothetical protein